MEPLLQNQNVITFSSIFSKIFNPSLVILEGFLCHVGCGYSLILQDKFTSESHEYVRIEYAFLSSVFKLNKMV